MPSFEDRGLVQRVAVFAFLCLFVLFQFYWLQEWKSLSNVGYPIHGPEPAAGSPISSSQDASSPTVFAPVTLSVNATADLRLVQMRPLDLYQSPMSVDTTVDGTIVVRIQGKDAAAHRVRNGGSVFYVRLVGPAYVMPSSEIDNGDGTYRFLLRPPLAGEYTLEVVHLYEQYRQRLTHLHTTGTDYAETISDNMKQCASSCHPAKSDEPVQRHPSQPDRQLQAHRYATCMQLCNDQAQAPMLIDERLHRHISYLADPGYTTLNQLQLVDRAPVCGLDAVASREGYWINATALCGSGTLSHLQCRRRLVLCSTTQYVISKFPMCSSELIWRPVNCRQAFWSSPAPLPLARVEAMRQSYINHTQENLMLFCGSSQTRELFEHMSLLAALSPRPDMDRLLANADPQITALFATDTDVRPRDERFRGRLMYTDLTAFCGSLRPSIFVMGFWGGISAAHLSYRSLPQVVQHLRDATSMISTITSLLRSRSKVIFQTGPAVHPYKANVTSTFLGYHGQRLFATNDQIAEFNRLAIEHLSMLLPAEHKLEQPVSTASDVDVSFNTFAPPSSYYDSDSSTSAVNRTSGSVARPRLLVADEFAMTYPLRGFQVDALNWWYHNSAHSFVVDNYCNLLISVSIAADDLTEVPLVAPPPSPVPDTLLQHSPPAAATAEPDFNYFRLHAVDDRPTD